MRQAFTLLELLVVIAIIAILAALTLGGFQYAQDATSRNRTVASHATLKAGLEQYNEKEGEYPEPATTGKTTNVSNTRVPVGGGLMLYQAITGDGDNEIKLNTPGSNVSDGQVDADESDRSINGNLPKSMIVQSSDGYYIADGWSRPFQYSKGGTNSVNPSYDLWSYGKVKVGTGMPEDLNSKKSSAITATWIKNW